MNSISYFLGVITIPAIIAIIVLGNYLNEHWIKSFRKDRQVSIESIIYTMEVLPNIKVWHLFGRFFFCHPFSLFVCQRKPNEKEIIKIKEMTKKRA